MAVPDLSGNELEYLTDCVDSTWISARGPYVEKFEKAFADFVGIEHAIAVSNGTVALHLILLGLGVGPGDEVIVPSLTYIATANAVKYVGATPVFVDSDPATWNIDPEAIARAITDKTRAVIPVHLYGAAADMKEINAICEKRGIAVIEDAAEALGTYIGDVHAGLHGTSGSFSFFANKTVTTGEGGMVVTHDQRLADRFRLLMDQGQSPVNKYQHDVIGYNYRITNLQAAVGTAQMERVEKFIATKQRIAGIYKSRFGDQPVRFAEINDGTTHAQWMTSMLIDDMDRASRDRLISRLNSLGIESRPFFFPIHKMAMYEDASGPSLPVCEDLGSRGISLPSSVTLCDEDISYVCDTFTSLLQTRDF